MNCEWSEYRLLSPVLLAIYDGVSGVLEGTLLRRLSKVQLNSDLGSNRAVRIISD